MKKIFISSFDLEVGGVERSLINMLNSFDYKNYEVDLMLYKHAGEFMEYLDNRVNLLQENKKYATIRESILEIFKKGEFELGVARLKAKFKKYKKTELENVSQMQYMWKYSEKYLPQIEDEYDVAISYLWPHYCVAYKVKAKKKIAWIHTDYSMIETNVEEDLKVWNMFDCIYAVSEACKESFLKKYPSLRNKVSEIENITSTKFIEKRANEKIQEMQSEDEFKILTVARLSYAKGIDNAIKALKILSDRGYKDIKWYVVGYGGDEEEIKALIKENELETKFIILGKKINPYPYIKACDLYVQPSRYEGKAVTVKEAQVLGKSIMITNYSTANSQINNLKDGYICELSIEGIASGIETLYKDRELRRKISQCCKQENHENVKELDKLYKFIEM